MKAKTERNNEAERLESEGLSYSEIGKRIGVSAQRACQICYHIRKRREERARESVSWASGVSARLYHVICNMKIESREQAIEMFPRLWPHKRPGKITPRNYGRKSHDELAALLGFPKPKYGVLICKHCGMPVNGG